MKTDENKPKFNWLNPSNLSLWTRFKLKFSDWICDQSINNFERFHTNIKITFGEYGHFKGMFRPNKILLYLLGIKINLDTDNNSTYSVTVHNFKFRSIHCKTKTYYLDQDHNSFKIRGNVYKIHIIEYKQT